MNTKALLGHAEWFFNRCKARLEGTGAEQYYDPKTDTQQFETMEMEELFEYAREEAYDLANYALMIALRVGEMQKHLAGDDLDELLNKVSDDATIEMFNDGDGFHVTLYYGEMVAMYAGATRREAVLGAVEKARKEQSNGDS